MSHQHLLLALNHANRPWWLKLPATFSSALMPGAVSLIPVSAGGTSNAAAPASTIAQSCITAQLPRLSFSENHFKTQNEENKDVLKKKDSCGADTRSRLWLIRCQRPDFSCFPLICSQFHHQRQKGCTNRFVSLKASFADRDENGPT